jgi:hypothetical protein
MQNTSSSGMTGKVMFLVLFRKAHIQVYAEFPQRSVFHNNRYGELGMMMVFTPTTSKKCRNVY